MADQNREGGTVELKKGQIEHEVALAKKDVRRGIRREWKGKRAVTFGEWHLFIRGGEAFLSIPYTVEGGVSLAYNVAL